MSASNKNFVAEFFNALLDTVLIKKISTDARLFMWNLVNNQNNEELMLTFTVNFKSNIDGYLFYDKVLVCNTISKTARQQLL